MTSDIPRLQEAALRPDEEVVERLAELMVKAKSGELRGFTFAGVGGNNKTLVNEAGDYNYNEMIAALDCAKHQLLTNWVRDNMKE